MYAIRSYYDEAMFVELQDMLVKGHHTQGRPVFNNVIKGLVFCLAVDDQVADPQIIGHYLKGGYPVAPLLGQQTLANNITDGIDKPVSDLRLLLLCKKAEDTVDGLTGINRVQSTSYNFV